MFLRNILISQNNNVKLGDFGVSRILREGETTEQRKVGTPLYIAKYLNYRKQCGNNVDMIWT